MIVDTSVWVQHLRHGEPRLVNLLEKGQVVTHPFVVGELACGNVRNRGEILSLLNALPEVSLADHEEAMNLVGAAQLHGRGIGWIDVHLLTSALLSGVRLWTLDRRLKETASALGVGF